MYACKTQILRIMQEIRYEAQNAIDADDWFRNIRRMPKTLFYIKNQIVYWDVVLNLFCTGLRCLIHRGSVIDQM